MAHIKSVDEYNDSINRMATRIKPNKTKHYIATQLWISKDSDPDGEYMEIDPYLDINLLNLVNKVLMKECRTMVLSKDKLKYCEYPNNEFWIEYAENDTTYQVKVDVISPITERVLSSWGIKSNRF